MTNKAIIKAIKSYDGVIIREKENDLFAICNGYDIEMITSSFYTVRKSINCKQYDAGSDYNPGGYIFLTRIKDLSYYLTQH